MKAVCAALMLLILFDCRNGKKQKNNPLPKVNDSVIAERKEQPIVEYRDAQLETFLDSVGRLSPQPFIEATSFMADSVFKNREALHITLTPADFTKLKQACKTKHLDIKTAKRIFGEAEIDSAYKDTDTLDITFVSIDNKQTDFKEFAVCPGNADVEPGCDLYFFSGNKIISKHNIYHRYGLAVNHYKDADGRTVIYYRENFESGSGIWWFNFYFYKYDDGKLLPVLNELESANLQPYWSVRSVWFKASVIKTNPLAIKMVYNQSFSDTTENPDFINDSTVVHYNWSEKTKTLVGNYGKSKISRSQILSYYIEDNELLFMNTYYKMLQLLLQNKAMRQRTLDYLNKVKNYYDNVATDNNR